MSTRDLAAPAPVIMILTCQRPERRSRPISNFQIRGEPNRATSLPDAQIHFPILSPLHGDVITAHPFKCLPAKATKINGERRPRNAPNMKCGSPDTKTRGHRARYCIFEISGALGIHDAPDIVGAASLQRIYRYRYVVVRDHCVAINSNNNFACCRLDSGI